MSKPLQVPQAILFDWDNTLVDTWPIIHEALNHCLSEMGHPLWSLAQVKAHIKKSMRDAFPDMFGDKWEDAASIYQHYYRSIHLHNLNALDGAADLLRWLSAQSVYLALVSNKRGPSLRLECDHLGWNGYFSRIVGADDAAHDKPDPAPAVMALEGTALLDEPSRIWFIGDTVVDLECAHNLGATAILYGDVATQNGVYEGFAFDYHVKSHADFLRLLQTSFSVAV